MIFPRASIKVTGEDAGAGVSSWTAVSQPRGQEKTARAVKGSHSQKGGKDPIWVHGWALRQPELLLSSRPLLHLCLSSSEAKLTKIRLRHGHGPLGRWCGSGSWVEVHVIQGLIHRLPRVLPCGDFFYVTKRRKTIISLIVSIIIIITSNNTTVK